MMHYKRRLIPVNLLDIPAVETWLADLAEKGLFLVSSGNYFAKFETAEPAKVTYRLEVTANPFLRADPDNKKILFFQEFGWEYPNHFPWFPLRKSNRRIPCGLHPREITATAFCTIKPFLRRSSIQCGRLPLSTAVNGRTTPTGPIPLSLRWSYTVCAFPPLQGRHCTA